MKIISLLFALCLTPLIVYAADDPFEDPAQSLEKADLIQRPTCMMPDFQKKAIETMKTYLQNLPALSSISQRHKQLKIANLKSFEKVDVSHFTIEDDYSTANALLMIKINKKVEERDILLCRQENIKKDPVYIIVYPYMDNFKADVINLDKNQVDYEAVSFIYP